MRFIAKGYFRLTVSGQEHIPPSGPVIFAANHCSFLDPPLIGLGVTRQVSFLAKKELFDIPLLGRWLSWVGSYPVSRGKGDAQAVRMSLKLLKQGAAILAFPEGTRSRNGKLQALEPGVAWLAVKSGADIIPIYVYNTYLAMPPDGKFPKPYKVSLAVCPAIKASDYQNMKADDAIKKINLELEKTLKSREMASLKKVEKIMMTN